MDQMSARIKRIERNRVGLFLIAGSEASKGPQAGKWTRFRRSLGRIGLLGRSPIASILWARAKRKAGAGKGHANAAAKPQRARGLAECANDGIVMGC